MTPQKDAWDGFVYAFAKSLGIVRLRGWLTSKFHRHADEDGCPICEGGDGPACPSHFL